MRNLISLASAILFLAFASSAYSDSQFPQRDCKDGKCRPPRPVCFNVFCSYDWQQGEHHTRCEAASTFTQLVTDDGGEISNNSVPPFNPALQIQCDDTTLYNGPAHRYTDRLGTRLQGIPGPYPAIILPEGALKELRHYSESSLELRERRLSGYCYIYTGPQLF